MTHIVMLEIELYGDTPEESAQILADLIALREPLFLTVSDGETTTTVELPKPEVSA